MTGTYLRVKHVAAPVRQQVYEQLKRAVVESHFSEGRRLTERELTELLGVSRPTVREALQQLAAEKLVTMVPGRGWVVSSLEPEQAQDLYDVRALLEGLAARRFVERSSAQDVTDLKASLRRIETVLAAPESVTQMIDVKAEFYEILLRGARSEAIAALLTTLHARISLLRANSLTHPGRPAQTVRELRRIVRRIAAKDADGAEQACVDHIRKAARVALVNAPATAKGESA